MQGRTVPIESTRRCRYRGRWIDVRSVLGHLVVLAIGWSYFHGFAASDAPQPANDAPRSATGEPRPVTAAHRGPKSKSCGRERRLFSGMNTTCALVGRNRRMTCWGADIHGTLSFGEARTLDRCDSATHSVEGVRCSLHPLPLPIDRVRDADIGEVSCAVRDDGDAACWGADTVGSDRRADFTRKPWIGHYKIPSEIVHVSSFEKRALWLRNDGKVIDMPSADGKPRAPNPFSELSGVRQLATGLLNACAVTSDDRVFCVGPRLGNPACPKDSKCSQRALEVPDLRARAVALGGARVCALTVDRQVSCWGSYGHSDRTTESMYSPQLVRGLPPISMIGGGGGHACAVAADSGETYCWGPRTRATRSAEMDAPVTPEPVVERIAGLTKPCELAGGLLHMCAVTADGAVYCWGTGGYGTLGSGTVEDLPTQPVRALPPGSVVY